MREIADESGVNFEDVAGSNGSGSRTLTEEEQKEQERRFAAAWEAMLVESLNGRMNPEDVSGKGSESASAKGKDTPQQPGNMAGTEQPCG